MTVQIKQSIQEPLAPSIHRNYCEHIYTIELSQTLLIRGKVVGTLTAAFVPYDNDQQITLDRNFRIACRMLTGREARALESAISTFLASKNIRLRTIDIMEQIIANVPDMAGQADIFTDKELIAMAGEPMDRLHQVTV